MGFIAKLIVNLILSGLGAIWPALKPKSPEAEAQKAQDEAASANSLLKAKVEGEKIEKSVADSVAADPGSLRKPDKFELN